jgi:RNA polymerase sigma-70 factor (ECF subfamily)
MTPGAGPDDASLVRASLEGDREAFAVLVSRHAHSVLSVTTRMLGTADAEDVAQETFVSAYKALPGFQFSAKFSTWLYRIAVNKCHDVLRTRREGVISLDTEDGEELAWKAVDDETRRRDLEPIELAWELDKSIQALPPLYRESFVLRHVEGLGYDEMSEILGINRDTLKMRVYKARILLCRSLAHLEGVRR